MQGDFQEFNRLSMLLHQSLYNPSVGLFTCLHNPAGEELENQPREVHFSENNDGYCRGSRGHLIYKTFSLYPSALKLMYLPLFTFLSLPPAHICMSSALTAAHLIDPV